METIQEQAEKINSKFFDEKCEKSINSWEACCYIDEFMQTVYYHSIFKHINKNFASILDVGCGQADLLYYLNKNKIKCKYKGIDVSEKMINICKNLYPNDLYNSNIFFEKSSLLSIPNETKYDVVVAVGTFNIKFLNKTQQIEYIKDNIKKMFELCNKCCSFTLLSKHGYETKEDGLFFCEPSEVIDYCLSLTSSVIIDHCSAPIEFITTLYKEF